MYGEGIMNDIGTTPTGLASHMNTVVTTPTL